MKRKSFLKSIGIAGAGLVVPAGALHAVNNDQNRTESCVLIPTETAGPFPLDLTDNEFYFRQDVRETELGVQLNLKMKIIGNADCLPLENLRVNIWHCSKDGLYSGYDTGLNPGQTGLTYLRGYQITDANGEVEFITILPGWYPGRVCHIHFQVYVSTTYAAISQLTFDHETKNAIYLANAGLYTKGPDPLMPGDDGVFSDGYTYQISALTENTATGGYDAYLEVTIVDDGTIGIGVQESYQAQYVQLGQNFPNPFSGETNIPFSISEASTVQIEFFNLNGQRLKTIDLMQLPAGAHNYPANLDNLQLPATNLVYQITVKNDKGIFRECKIMTAEKV